MFALSRRVSRKSLRILAYHGLWTTPGYQYGNHLFMRPEQFERRMSWLRNSRYPVLPLAEAVQRLEDGSLPDHAVVITIDDGWSSTYSHMLPILEGLALPATVYVTTWYADHQIPVVNVVVDYILRRAGRSPSERFAIIAEIVKLPSLAQREQALRACAARFGVTTDEWWESRQFHLMSAAEIGAADRRGLDIQLHTHRHRSSDVASDHLEREIADNRAALARACGRPEQSFQTFLLSQRAGSFLRGCGSRSCRGRFGDPDRERDQPAGRQSLSAAPVSRWPSGLRGRVRGLFERRPGAVPHRQKPGDRGRLTSQTWRTKLRPRAAEEARIRVSTGWPYQLPAADVSRWPGKQRRSLIVPRQCVSLQPSSGRPRAPRGSTKLPARQWDLQKPSTSTRWSRLVTAAAARSAIQGCI